MKALPLDENYNPCSAADAKHVQLKFPGPFPDRRLPVILSGQRDGTPCWTWNGDVENPTLTPSIRTRADYGKGMVVCHSFVNDGFIQFLTDSTHEYSGQTIALLEI